MMNKRSLSLFRLTTSCGVNVSSVRSEQSFSSEPFPSKGSTIFASVPSNSRCTFKQIHDFFQSPFASLRSPKSLVQVVFAAIKHWSMRVNKIKSPHQSNVECCAGPCNKKGKAPNHNPELYTKQISDRSTSYEYILNDEVCIFYDQDLRVGISPRTRTSINSPKTVVNKFGHCCTICTGVLF